MRWPAKLRQRLRAAAWACACLCAALRPGSAGAAGPVRADRPPHSAGRLILSHDGYWRCHYRYGGPRVDPDLLKSQGVRFTNPTFAKRLVQLQQVGRPFFAGGDGPAFELWDNGPPPAGWADPAFDDDAWPRCRRPDFMGRPGPAGERVRTGCFRGTFLLPSASDYGELVLRLAYRGGARVLLNGKEIARGHLRFDKLTALSEEVSNRDRSRLETSAEGPTGPLDAAARGEPYAPNAYVVLDEEFTPDFPNRGRPALWPEVPDPSGFDRWEPASGPKDRKAGLKRVAHGCPGIGRRTAERLAKARNRILGPMPLPPGLLRKGRNVLAVEFRASDYHPAVLACGVDCGRPRVRPWRHGGIERIELFAGGKQVPSTLRRPAGVQAWVEDMHARVFSTEYLEPGAATGEVRMVAARNGTYSAQVVVGTDRKLEDFQLSVGGLKSPTGGVLAAGAWTARIMGSHPAKALLEMGLDDYDHKPHYQYRYAVARYARGDAANPAAAQTLRFFDRLGRRPTATVPAGTCQPVWLSLRVPPDTRPGTYRGKVKVRARGMAPVSIPAEVEVIDWRVPDPRDFATVVAAEQSPYGLARQYDVPVWSERHFRLMAESFALLARLGNDWLFVPVLSDTEFGNRKGSPIRWIRRRDGRLTFDYSVLDRYLDLAAEHWGRPRVISFVIAHGNPCADSQVQVFDEVTGRTRTLNLGVDHMEDTPVVDQEHKEVWRGFAAALYAHMKSRGMEESMHWGFTWDAPANRDFMKFLRKVVPRVSWTRSAHFAGVDEFYKAVTQCYGFRGDGMMNGRGWRHKDLWLSNSRRGWFGAFVGCAGVDTPFMFRYWPEQALSFGHRGIGRIGADYWGIWRDGCQVLQMGKTRGRTKGTVGYAITSILSPGPDGPESSARMEALLEGVQETEARIFIERALDRARLSPGLADRLRKVLRRRSRATAAIMCSSGSHQHDFAWQDWPERSRALYQAAADLARVLKAPTGTAATTAATTRASR